jgi:hypothetical protein
MKYPKACIGFEVLTAVVTKNTVFWDIMLCSPLEVKRRFGVTCRLRLQGRGISRARNQCESRWKTEIGNRDLGLCKEIKRRLNSGNALLPFSPLLCCLKRKIRIYKTIILSVVLYGCETWSLTLRKKQRLRMFENRVLRRIFGPKRDEMTGDWRKLHNEELHNVYHSPIII